MGDYSGTGQKAGMNPSPQKATSASSMSDEDVTKLQQQIQLLQQQNEAERQKQELARTSQPELKYNPIVETTGPDGKKTIGLREELQLRSPEEFITKEQERFGLQKASDLDQLRQEQAQKEAQQRVLMQTRGGMRGGVSPLARYSMRDALAARQGLLGSQAKQEAEFGSQAEQLRSKAREQQVGLLGGAIKDVEKFNLDRWMKQKEVEAAKETAAATRAAGSGGK